MTSRSLLIGITTVAVFTLAACGEPDVKGTPTSASEPTSTSSETTSIPTANLADTDPCTLLTKAELAQLQPKREPERQKRSLVDSCNLRLPGYAAGVDIRTDVGLSEVRANGGQITDTTINGRKAKQVSGQVAGNGCLVALDVTESSRVDVQVAGDGTEQCAKAKQIAELVAPKLPK